MKYFSLPTWLLACLAIRVSSAHVWKNKEGRLVYDLKQWYEGASSLAFVMDTIFWLELSLLVRHTFVFFQ